MDIFATEARVWTFIDSDNGIDAYLTRLVTVPGLLCSLPLRLSELCGENNIEPCSYYEFLGYLDRGTWPSVRSFCKASY